MRLTTVQSVLALALSVHLGIGTAATPAIGTALSSGAFRLDQSTVSGNATLFEGSVLETNAAASSVQLNSGARFSLSPESRGRLFGDRLVLEKGASQVENSTGFRFVALGLTIQPDRGSSTGNIVFEGPRRLRVASTNGALRVLNSNGVLIANLAPGSALAFEPQDGVANATRIVGRLQSKGNHYLVTDEVTNVTMEVLAQYPETQKPEKLVGRRVEVVGALDPTATPISEATQLVRAREINPLDDSKKAVAAAAGAGGAAAGSATGMTVTTITIIGGVAAGAAVGGLAAADALPGQGGSRNVSR